MGNVKSEIRKKRVVRWILLWASLGWGISFWFALVPWDSAVSGLEEMGARPIPFDPFRDYWMRVIGLIFFLFGIGCFLFALRLERYAVIIPLVGWFHLIVGAGSLVTAITMGLLISSYPTLVAEITFSTVIGVFLLVYGDFSYPDREE